MASNRAFKGLASLKSSFSDPNIEQDDQRQPHLGEPEAVPAKMPPQATYDSHLDLPPASYVATTMSGKVDRRRLRKVLKAPSVSLSVEVRTELHNDVRNMLFARNSTWIALLDELLTAYVQDAKSKDRFPK